jgi:hypothetical protein
LESGLEPDTYALANIDIKPQRDVLAEMVAVRIDEQSRRANPLLREVIYIDSVQTKPLADSVADSVAPGDVRGIKVDAPYAGYAAAARWVENKQKRLATAAEYDAIIKAVQHGDAISMKTGKAIEVNDLFDEFPEYSATVKSMKGVVGMDVDNQFRDMRILKGFKDISKFPELTPWIDGDLLARPDTRSERICNRGVRSATPRFVKP